MTALRSNPSVRLQPANAEQIPFMMKLEADHANDVFTWTKAQHQKALKSKAFAQMIIEDAASGEAVGYLLLETPQNEHRTVYLSRLLIALKNRGYGSAAMEALKAYAFDVLQAHRLYLEANSNTQSTQRFYEHCGFIHEGRLRDSYLDDATHVFCSTELYSLLEQEYRAQQTAKSASVKSPRPVELQLKTPEKCISGYTDFVLAHEPPHKSRCAERMI